jgi:hypothetical protein
MGIQIEVPKEKIRRFAGGIIFAALRFLALYCVMTFGRTAM